MSTKHQHFKLSLPGYSAEEREAIGLEVLDTIRKRTKSGKDKNGEPFAPYSKGYKESANFKIAGKGSKVDLSLTEDMLDSMQILNNTRSGVDLGYENGTDQNGKADGNIRGTYGKPRKVGPARDFLGITQEELDRILRKYPKDSDKAEQRARERLIAEQGADRLSGKVNVDDLED